MWVKLSFFLACIPLGVMPETAPISLTSEWLGFIAHVIASIAVPGLILTLAFMFRHETSALLRRIVRVKLPGFELTLADIAKIEALLIQSGEKPPPRPPSLLTMSPRERIKRDWQRVHDTLADVYRTATKKEPPPQYKRLASRLRRWGHLTDENVWNLVNEVRAVYRRRTSEANCDLAEWYAATVEKVIKRIDEETKE